MKKVLIIGGAGFIGSHTADELAQNGFAVRILDILSPKTHSGDWPEYLDSNYEKIQGDARDRQTLLEALQGVDYVYHFAAQMDLLPIFSQFFDTNVTSTALLYELIVEHKLPIQKVVVASSQFVYGEGRWYCDVDGEVFPSARLESDLIQMHWDPVCPKCRGKITPLANLETHQDPPNQYAISKYTQELIALKLGGLYKIPSVAMRYSIVHGPRQSLKNAYSGALRTFTLKLLLGEHLATFEDNEQQRDFVSVYDVARANRQVLEDQNIQCESFNVGGGKAYTITQLAKIVADELGTEAIFSPSVEFRVGDIRHAVSDISKLKSIGWLPQRSEEQIVKEYIQWVKQQNINTSYLKEAEQKIRSMGVVKKSSA
jgi:dTDP-L-rhamnose 4-epimerase